MKTVKVMFKDEKYNYSTSISPKVTFEEATAYFVGKWFNLGCEDDNMQQCIAIIYE